MKKKAVFQLWSWRRHFYTSRSGKSREILQKSPLFAGMQRVALQETGAMVLAAAITAEGLTAKEAWEPRTEAEEGNTQEKADTAEDARAKTAAEDRRAAAKEDTAAPLRATARQKAEADGVAERIFIGGS